MVKKKTMKCPECGRTVLIDDVVCPDCGTYIDDTDPMEVEDPEEEYSDSFEEEFQGMYEDPEPDPEEGETIQLYRNLHTTGELHRLDVLLEALRKACKEVEEKHIQLKRLYRLREKLRADLHLPEPLIYLIPLAGTLYEHQRKHVRGVCWIRHIANMISRGISTDYMEDWDQDYCERVLLWLPLEDELRAEILEVFRHW